MATDIFAFAIQSTQPGDTIGQVAKANIDIKEVADRPGRGVTLRNRMKAIYRQPGLFLRCPQRAGLWRLSGIDKACDGLQQPRRFVFTDSGPPTHLLDQHDTVSHWVIRQQNRRIGSNKDLSCDRF